MKRSAAWLLSLVFCLMATSMVLAAGNPQTAVSVRALSTVRNGGLTLGDIADISGSQSERVRYLQELKLGDAPAPGATLTLTPQSLEVRLLATKANFSAIKWSVPSTIQVKRESQRVSGKTIGDLAQGLISQAAQGATVKLVDGPDDLEVPLGRLEMTPELAGGIRYNGPTTVQVSIRTEGELFARIPVQFEVKRYLDVVVTVDNLNAGEIISARAVRLETMDVGKLQPGYLTDLAKVVGLQARHAIPPGNVLHERSLTRPILVKSGEMVRIAARIGEIEVVAMGQALSQGAAGDLIRVQNLNTKRMLTGRVQEDKSILVLNQQGG